MTRGRIPPGVRLSRVNEWSSSMARQSWTVEACVAPGERRIVSILDAESAEDAIAQSRARHGTAYTRYCATPNYVATGKVEMPVWEKE